MELRVLGPIEVYNGHKLAVGGPRQRRIVAALALNAGDVVSIGRLASIAWSGEEPPASAERNVRSYVSRIREGLGDAADRLVTASPGYVLELRPDELDATEMANRASLADQAFEAGDLDAALEHTESGLGLWRGVPYAEFSDEDWVLPEVHRLGDIHSHLVERRCEVLIEVGRADEALAHLRTLIAEEPLRERPRRLQMLALYQSGRAPEALRAFQDFRALLADEIGVEPSAEIVELDRQILAEAPELQQAPRAERSIRGYRLSERIGEGAFSVVYRGTQPSLKRDVAVKQIRAELANRPEFIRRFEAEAQTVASLEHPHIVPLYDYWREPGAAYLVMRWLRGGTLESRLRERRLDPDEAVMMASQVGSALSAAHAAGVVHRDVKSPNVFLDEQGNYYLGDFGIAVDAETRHDPEALLSAGSPAYASPEQLRREVVGPPSDVHSLGIVVYEALTGQLPFPAERSHADLLQRQLYDPIPEVRPLRPDVPPAVDEVLQRATAKRADSRYATIDELVDALTAAVAGDDGRARAAAVRGSVTTIGIGANPYKGLAAFKEADADDFFGRSRLVDRLVEQMQADGPEGRLVAAVGPSGSGKSSVVRAGLIPRIRAGAIEGSEEWFITTMIPGPNPFEELEAALSRIAVAPTVGLIETMQTDQRGIARGVKAALPDEASELVIVVDQFEELFTLVDDEAVRQAFIAGLADAVTNPRSRLRLVVTIRADFWDRPLRHPELARILQASAVTVTPLAADELEHAIVDPAARVGVELEPGLAPVIAADVLDQPGALPLLQYTLTELFDHQISGLMLADTYHELGGVTGALARRADELYQSASPDEQAGTRSLFSRLVTPGEGVEDTRRRVPRSELSSIPDTVVDRFGAARLVAFDLDPSTREPTVEVAHEALIREWPRLRGWLDEDRDMLRIHRHLTAAAGAWRAAGEDPSELYRGGRLEAAEPLLDSGDLNEQEAAFLQRSIDQRAAEADAERQRVRRLRRLTAATAVVAVLALITGSVAAVQWSRANDEADTAQLAAAEAEEARDAADAAREEAVTNAELADQRAEEANAAEAQADLERLLALARTADPIDPTTGILLAVEAHRASPSVETLDALHRALTARPGFMGTLPAGQIGGDIAALDGGDRIFVHTDESIQLWDVGDRTIVHEWPAEIPGGSELDLRTAASANGRVVAATTHVQTRAFDTATGNTVLIADHAESGAALAVAVSPDSNHVAVGLAHGPESGTVQVWQTTTGDLVAESEDLGSPVVEVEWHPDGSSVGLITQFAGAAMWSLDELEPLWQMSGEFADLLFSTDGERLVLSEIEPSEGFSRRGQLRVVDPDDGTDLQDPLVFSPDEGRVSAIDWWDRAETRVAGLGGTTSTKIIDLATGTVVQTINPESEEEGSGGGNDTGLAVLPSHGVLATGGLGGVELRDMDGTGPLARLAHLPVELRDMPERWLVPAFDVDGQTFVVSTLFDPVPPFSYDLTDAQLLPEPAAAIIPEAVELVLTAGEHSAHVTATSTTVRSGLNGDPVGPPLATVPTTYASIGFLSPAGDRYAQADGRAVVLYDTDTGEVITRLDDELPTPDSIPLSDFWAVWFSEDGKTMVVMAASHRATALVDAQSGEVLWTSTEMGRAFPLDGERYLASSDETGAITLHDPFTREEVAEPLVGHTGLVTWVLPHPVDPDIALSAGRDGTTRVWDLASGTQLGRELRTELFSTRSWSPDGNTLANPGSNGFELWNYDTDTWADIACQVAGRNLTQAEWERIGPRSWTYRATCDAYPIAKDT